MCHQWLDFCMKNKKIEIPQFTLKRMLTYKKTLLECLQGSDHSPLVLCAPLFLHTHLDQDLGVLDDGQGQGDSLVGQRVALPVSGISIVRRRCWAMAGWQAGNMLGQDCVVVDTKQVKC